MIPLERRYAMEWVETRIITACYRTLLLLNSMLKLAGWQNVAT
jgi:hypothetical protein